MTTLSYSRIRIALAFLVCAVTSVTAVATACKSISSTQVLTESGAPIVKPIASLCVANKKYSILHDDRGTKTSLKSPGRTDVLHRIPKGFEPSLVGSDVLIGFLPDYLQLHITRKIVFYISTIRTNGGGGGGQCGSGTEIFLHVLDLKQARPKILASHRIGSCHGIGLADTDESTPNLGNLSVSNGKFVLKFVNYPDQESPTYATLSNDFKRLEFNPANK